jgi:hypothetical protein
MVIRYKDGSEIEAILLSRKEGTIRVAAKDVDDALEFTEVNGAWISDDWEPVQIRFEWERSSQPVMVSEADCICSQELVAELIGGLDPARWISTCSTERVIQSHIRSCPRTRF